MNKEFLCTTPPWFKEFHASLSRREVFSNKNSQIIEKSGKRREYVSRLFTKATGDTISNYINKQRIEYASKLLTETDSHIIDIALESGFENLSTFYHLFKPIKGCTPKQYRDKYNRVKTGI